MEEISSHTGFQLSIPPGIIILFLTQFWMGVEIGWDGLDKVDLSSILLLVKMKLSCVPNISSLGLMELLFSFLLNIFLPGGWGFERGGITVFFSNFF